MLLYYRMETFSIQLQFSICFHGWISFLLLTAPNYLVNVKISRRKKTQEAVREFEKISDPTSSCFSDTTSVLCDHSSRRTCWWAWHHQKALYTFYTVNSRNISCIKYGLNVSCKSNYPLAKCCPVWTEHQQLCSARPKHT